MTTTKRPGFLPTPLEIVTGLALAAAIFFLFIYDAHAGEVYSFTRTGRGSFMATFGNVSADTKIINVPAPADEAAAEAFERRWVAYCQPVGVVDQFGVERLAYAKPGCEFGRDHD